MSFSGKPEEQLLSLTEAKKKLMDFVARRDQSEIELREKLSPHCSDKTLEETIQWARKQNWLATPEKLVLTKWPADAFKNLSPAAARKLKAKIARFLAARGFESDTVDLILKNEFKTTSLNEEEIYDEEF